ncbi:MAG: hypothetical protein V1720_09245 [bacterium]
MKTKILFGIFLLFGILMFVNCGGGDEKQNQQNSQKEESSDNPKDMKEYAEKMKEAAESMMGGGDSNKEPVPPVSFKKLMEYLPQSLGSMKPGKPEGESVTMGNWSHSTANISFDNEDYSQSASVKINDFAFINALYLPYRMLFNMQYQRETSDGYEKSLKVAGFPAFEKWDESGKSNEVTVLVGDRFIVEVRTNGLGKGSAKSVIENMDLSGLSGEKTN